MKDLRKAEINRYEQRINELLLLQNTALKINSILDFDLLLEEIVKDVAEVLGCSHTVILLIDKQRNELCTAALHGWPNADLKGHRFKIGQEGMVGQVAKTGQTYYAPDISQNPHYIITEKTTLSEVDIPLTIRGELIGVFDAQHQELNAFPPNKIQLLEALAAHISVAVENARLFRSERMAKERLIKEQEEARKIQEDLFPTFFPLLKGFKIQGTCLPAGLVGGDWYDFIQLENGCWGIVLGDVVGKGMSAALLMSGARSITRLIAPTVHSPAEVLAKVNQILTADFAPGKFITMIYAVVDPQNQNITFANAGHLWPILVDEAGARLFDTESELPLGIRIRPYHEYKIEMRPGMRLILYSDGITEAMNQNKEEYGVESLLQHTSLAHCSLESLLEDVRKFTGSCIRADDSTIVMIDQV